MVKFSNTTAQDLRAIIHDDAILTAFIRKAQTAIEVYLICRRLPDPDASRADVKRLLAAACRLQSAQERIHSKQRPRLDTDALLNVISEVIAQARIELASPSVARGRRVDGAGTILIKTLADAFPLRVSAGDRSRFVRTVELINADQRLEIVDVRQKVRDALRRINSTKHAK